MSFSMGERSGLQQRLKYREKDNTELRLIVS